MAHVRSLLLLLRRRLLMPANCLKSMPAKAWTMAARGSIGIHTYVCKGGAAVLPAT